MEVKNSQKGIAIKKSILILGLIIWNVFFIYDIIQTGFLSSGSMLAVTLLFIALILILISSDFRKVIFKEGVELSDVKKSIYIMLLLSGSFILIMTVLSYQ